MYEQVRLGIDIETLVGSRIGNYLLDRMKEERDTALEGLAGVDPHDPRAIRDFQFRIRVVDAIEGWLQDAVTEARNAEQTLRDLDG